MEVSWILTFVMCLHVSVAFVLPSSVGLANANTRSVDIGNSTRCKQQASPKADVEGEKQSSFGYKTMSTGSKLQMGLADDVVPAILQRFTEGEVKRVLDAWEGIRSGNAVTNEWDDKGCQVAASYIADLFTEPWHNVDNYPWIQQLESGASIIRDELREVCFTRGEKSAVGWVAATEDDADAYGEGWRKLVLQDRAWNTAACNLLPKTTDIIKHAGVPSVDIYFATQKAGSGVKAHTESTNFYLTAHLALEIPDRDCWLRVGKERREWIEGKALAYDSSFVHDARNDGTCDMIGLVVKFWHPQISPVERDALEFIFDILRDPSTLNHPIGRSAEIFSSDETDTRTSRRVESTEVGLELHSLLDNIPVSAAGQPERSPGNSTLDEDAEAKRFDNFVADLKAEGLLPGVGTPDQYVASKTQKNRDDRRKAAKKRKKQSASLGKGRKR